MRRLFVLLIACSACFAVPAFVQSTATAAAGVAGSSTTLTLTGVVAGDMLVVGLLDGGGTITSVTHTGDTFIKATSLAASSLQDVEIWYAMNAVGGSTTVTITGGAGSAYFWAALNEYSGVPITLALDKVAIASGAGRTANSGNTASTTVASELLVSMVDWAGCTSGPSATAGTGYTSRQTGTCGANSDEDILQDRVVSSTGAYAGQSVGGTGTDTTWVAAVVTFKSATSTAAQRSQLILY